jgi:hypothetical protein
MTIYHAGAEMRELTIPLAYRFEEGKWKNPTFSLKLRRSHSASSRN